MSTLAAPRSACRFRALLSARFHLAGSLSLTCMTTRFWAAAAVDCGRRRTRDQRGGQRERGETCERRACGACERGTLRCLRRNGTAGDSGPQDDHYARVAAAAFGDNRADAPRPCADIGHPARRRLRPLLHAARHDHEVHDAALSGAVARLGALRRADARDARLARPEHAARPAAHPAPAAAALPRDDRARIVAALRQRAAVAAARRSDGAQLFDAGHRRRSWRGCFSASR